MNYPELLNGSGEPLEIFAQIAMCLEDITKFPFLLESICRSALMLDEDELNRLRFALLRLQVHADIHHYEDMEETQKMKYIAQVIEIVVFGNLLLQYAVETTE